MSKQQGYRIPPERKGCKYDGTYWETLGESWMGQCSMFECLWFEKCPMQDDSKAKAIEDNLDNYDFECGEKCVGFEPSETIICPKHDIEYLVGEWCDLCHPEMEGNS